MKQVAIHDANIFIDLEVAGLLDLWFQLDYETITSDIVVSEIEDNHKEVLQYIQAGQIRVEQLNSKQMAMVYDMHNNTNSNLAIADCAVLLLSREKAAILLTGDRCLREAAEGESIEVHGSLWIFDKLVTAGFLQPAIAANKLEDLLVSNRFLPRATSYDYIKKWKQ